VEEALKIEVSESGVMMDDKPVTQLKHFAFDANDLETNGTPRSLNAALVAYRAAEKDRAPSSVDGAAPAANAAAQPPRAPRLLVLADQKTPYSTLKAVMTTAAIHGFGTFKLVVVEDR